MVGLRTHFAFLGAFFVVASELIKILPVCDKECQEHLIFNKYTQAQAAWQVPKKTSPQLRTPGTSDRLSQPHATSVQRVPLAKGIVGTRSNTITTVSSIHSGSQKSGGTKYSSIPHVVRGSAATSSVQQYTVSKSSVQQYRSSNSPRILSPPSTAMPQIVHKKPMSAASTSPMQANLHVQSVTSASMRRSFEVKTPENLQNKNGSTSNKVSNAVHAKPSPETCKKNAIPSKKRLYDKAAATAVQKSTTVPLGELVSLFAKALTEILDKECRFGKCVGQGKDTAASRGISAGMCLEIPVQKIGALEQGINALQWRLQKLEMASTNAHPIQYIIPQYYPYVYPPYYGGANYSNPPSAQQTSHVKGSSLGEAVEKEQKDSGGAEQNAAPHIEKHSENDTDKAARSTQNSETGIEIDEEAEDDVSDADSHNKGIAHEGNSRNVSYEIRGKDAWDQVLSDTRKALFSKLRGEVIDLRGDSRRIGGFSFVGSKDAEEAAPVSFEMKMHRKRSGLIDDEKWANSAAMSQTMFQKGRHAYVPSEEVNPYMPREEKMQTSDAYDISQKQNALLRQVQSEEKMQTGNAYNVSQKQNALLRQVQNEDEVQNVARSEKVIEMNRGINHIDISRNTMKTRPLYQNLEELGYKEPEKGGSILELVRRRQDRSSEDGDMLHRTYDSSSGDHGSHSESAEYVYLSDLIRLCSRRQ